MSAEKEVVVTITPLEQLQHFYVCNLQSGPYAVCAAIQLLADELVAVKAKLSELESK